jgi:RNA polymerase sigma-70 factor (ECF subfamily)
MGPVSIDEIIRVEGGQVVATLFRMTGRLELSEDAFGEAALEALRRWRTDGLPERPGAWLTTVARRKAIDMLRRETQRPQREEMASALAAPSQLEVHTVRDDQLRLIFMVCHPSLSREAQVALTLRVVCGVGVEEIAAAFFVPEATMSKRITRAKAKLRSNRVGFRIPPDEELPDRLAAVLSVIELVFSTGHHAPVGDSLIRVDLVDEGVRLARLLADLMPDEPECHGLVALLLSTRARGATRVGEDGELVLLADSDRSRWDRDEIEEAIDLLERTLKAGRAGPFQIRAAISCLHSHAPSVDDTDWPQIVQLYDVLNVLAPSPVVVVNRSIALAEVDGPAAALESLEGVRPAVQRWHMFHAARADFLRRLGDLDGAADALREALQCPHNEVDGQLLRRRLLDLENVEPWS